MLNTAFTQPLQNRALRCLTFIPQRIVHIAALFALCRQSGRAAQVRLVGKHHDEFSLLAIGCALHHPRRDLGRDGSPARRAALNAMHARRRSLPELRWQLRR